MKTFPSATIRIRISDSDAHYAGGLVSGAKVMELFGDVATEILIRHDGNEGLFRAYRDVEFLAPIRAGDFIEVTGEMVRVGKTSRDISFKALKLIERVKNSSRAKILKKPVLVAVAHGTCVVKKT